MTTIFKSAPIKSAAVLLFSAAVGLTSCKMPVSADKFFGVAVLNTNNITEFGTPRYIKHINDQTIEFADVPSSKNKGDEAEKNIQTQVAVCEQNLKDIQELPESSDNKEIKDLSVALYQYVIPVYKNEYMAYAKLCDAKAPQEEKDALAKKIEDQYSAGFEQRYAKLMELGKAYAGKHGLNVKFD